MREIISKYISINDINVVPLWTDSEFLKPIAKSNNNFLKDLGIETKFIVQYSGNLGRTHSVDVLVEMAHLMKTDKDIIFIIIGK